MRDRDCAYFPTSYLAGSVTVTPGEPGSACVFVCARVCLSVNFPFRYNQNLLERTQRLFEMDTLALWELTMWLGQLASALPLLQGWGLNLRITVWLSADVFGRGGLRILAPESQDTTDPQTRRRLYLHNNVYFPGTSRL